MQINIRDYPALTNALLEELASATSTNIKDVPREFAIPLVTSLCKKLKAAHEYSSTFLGKPFPFDIVRDLTDLNRDLEGGQELSALSRLVIKTAVKADILRLTKQ